MMMDEKELAAREIGDNPYGGADAPRLPLGYMRPPMGGMSEAYYQQSVTNLADALGWQWIHHRLNTQTKPGWPDLTLWHPQHGIIFRELKRDGEDPTQAQYVMLRSLRDAGQDVAVWRLPEDWDDVVSTLRGGPEC